MAALDAVKAAQSENMGPVVTAVLDATGGDEQAFWKLMQEASDAGHPVALTWTAGQGIRQLSALGINPESAPEAVKLCAAVEKAASSGYVPAQVEMAHLLGSGVGTAPDEKKAMEYLMQACKAGSSRARAAYLLLSGRMEKGGTKDTAVAAELKKNNETEMALATRQVVAALKENITNLVVAKLGNDAGMYGCVKMVLG
jgi:TPR repeat protein